MLTYNQFKELWKVEYGTLDNGPRHEDGGDWYVKGCDKAYREYQAAIQGLPENDREDYMSHYRALHSFFCDATLVHFLEEVQP